MMKRISLILFSLMMCMCSYAQDETMSIDDVLNACIALQEADANNDSIAMRQAADSLRAQKSTSFTSLRCKDDSIQSLNGHFVFNDVFIDSLMAGANPYDNADNINRSTTHRGQTASGSILTKTCMVKAGKSTKYSFASRGRQELAVVAEAGGLVTMKIHVTNTAGFDKWFSDTVDVKKGRPHRKTAFDLPQNRRNTVELEVVNCGQKDISFVIISN